MNTSEIIAHIEAWKAVQVRMAEKMLAVEMLFSSPIDGPFSDAVYRLMSAHTDAVAKLVGDSENWLEWFAYECNYGDRPMAIDLTGSKRKIKTIKQLARLIEERTE